MMQRDRIFDCPNARHNRGTKRTVNVKFKFGATKITVEGFDNTSKQSVNVKIDFLENNPYCVYRQPEVIDMIF